MADSKAMDRGWLFRRLVRVFHAFGMGVGGPDHIDRVKAAATEMEDDISKQIVTATTTASEMILRSVFEEMDKRFHELMLKTAQKEQITELVNKDTTVH